MSLPERTMDQCADAGPDSPRSPLPLGHTRFVPRRDWGDYTRRVVELVEGRTYEAWHPFLREQYTDPYDFEDPASGATFCRPEPHDTWVPGFRFEPCGQYGEDTKETWDGEGVQLRTIVSIHKPGRYPARVFYVRQWRDPSGKVFGKTALRVITTGPFRAWMRGERWPAYSPARDAHCAWAMTPVSVAARAIGPRVAAGRLRETA